jgi:hypothetical protein
VVETPQLGYATYVFANPRSMQGLLALNTKIAKEDIRRATGVPVVAFFNGNYLSAGRPFLGDGRKNGDGRASGQLRGLRK